ncbi:hypothetical protein [Actinomadura sp. WAC 06369]|uniref:hypothetical protein n=1 Tax=Actinomadura sp. WAC 06369 TaxID=2203193 RepID=UPI000F79104A|nr:hypothetical protein [Actinomadura sp. WAC 06369]
MPRARPACRPLDERIREIADLARAAAEPTTTDPLATAASAQNKAALIASDCGMPDLARDLCQRHSALYLQARPLTARTARHALEPLVNLARLDIRAGAPNAARNNLEGLFRAVRDSDTVVIDGQEVPLADVTGSHDERHDLNQWLWSVVLADGIRALTGAGRWDDAVAHAERLRGVGRRLLDGRQAAIIAHVLAGEPETASRMLEQSTITEPWEQAVAACLSMFCHRSIGSTATSAKATKIEEYLALDAKPELVTFRTRVALTAIDLSGDAAYHGEDQMVHRVVDEALDLGDGYAAREILRHPRSGKQLTETQAKLLSAVTTSAGLGSGHVPAQLLEVLIGAVEKSQHVTASALATLPVDNLTECPSPRVFGSSKLTTDSA